MTVNEATNILIGVPCFGGLLQYRTANSLIQMDRLLGEQKINRQIKFIGNDALVPRVRNQFANAALFDSDSTGHGFSQAVMMLPDVDYLCPSHHFYGPKHKNLARAERLILDLKSSSKQRLAVAIHEANHALTARKKGIRTSYGGPSIEHFRNTDEWLAAFGRTQIPIKDWLAMSASNAARFSVAGRVAEIVLLGEAPDETSECDYLDFIYSGKGKPSDLISIWKHTEEQMLLELRNDLAAQQEIVHEAAVFEQNIYGLERSVKHGA